MSGLGSGELSLNLGLREFLSIVEHQAQPLIIPLCIELAFPNLTPDTIFSHLKKNYGFLLESIEGSEKIARYSYVGLNPELIVRIGESVHLSGSESFLSIARNPGGENAIDKVSSILHRFNFVNMRAPRFFGGMVGYFAYDLVYSLFSSVLSTTKPATNYPIAQFMLTKDCLVFDHFEKKMFIFCSPLLTYETDPEEEYEKSCESISHIAKGIADISDVPNHKLSRSTVMEDKEYSANITKGEFCQAVERVREYILAGDIYQAVISRRIDIDLDNSPFSIYRALRAINPSPYMYYLDFGDLHIIGASPEMLVRVERRKVTTVPIAGTRRRGNTPEEDDRLARDLLDDEKERAEHTMLVDLARNDVGRVCKFGSVKVHDFMSIERFSHVQHIVSTVTGMLRDDLDSYDALKSCFPAGTVSGAPKIRAMQIIDKMEPDRRDLYAGAVGYIGFDKNLEFAITIRTIIARSGTASIQVGAGIVADSIPENEWFETESKAKAMMKAIAAARDYS